MDALGLAYLLVYAVTALGVLLALVLYVVAIRLAWRWHWAAALVVALFPAAAYGAQMAKNASDRERADLLASATATYQVWPDQPVDLRGTTVLLIDANEICEALCDWLVEEAGVARLDSFSRSFQNAEPGERERDLFAEGWRWGKSRLFTFRDVAAEQTYEPFPPDPSLAYDYALYYQSVWDVDQVRYARALAPGAVPMGENGGALALVADPVFADGVLRLDPMQIRWIVPNVIVVRPETWPYFGQLDVDYAPAHEDLPGLLADHTVTSD